ncbi:MAG: VCBS repeat-containing protein [Nitrospirae bacterium]|nr:MAG: VCBS repeat-containing protein [Nitrospirota bacterium]
MKRKTSPLFSPEIRSYLLIGGLFFFTLIFVVSCTTTKERISRPSVAVKQLPDIKPSVPSLGPQAQPGKTVQFKCNDESSKMFNASGVDATPFARLAFYDFDGDGVEDMVVGGKEGDLLLFKNIGTQERREWALVKGYFSGINANAFSSPAIGDIDNDGMAEVVLGTGGFSSESGRIHIYKNNGTASKPLWVKSNAGEISIGNDAVPALVDLNNDGRPDIVAGNSEGRLFAFINETSKAKVRFKKDNGYFRNINAGTYAAPAAVVRDGSVLVIVGNSMGKVYSLEKPGRTKAFGGRKQLGISTTSFAAPAFMGGRKGTKDLILTDGIGEFHYFKNSDGDYINWEHDSNFLQGRVFAGPALSPAVNDLKIRSCIVLGNIAGDLSLYEYDGSRKLVPWNERSGYFKGIKLPGFSKGLLTEWRGVTVLITGQQDGILRAFYNRGGDDSPDWVEEKNFFRNIPKIMHAAPALFDIDGDSVQELIVGDSEGRIHGFKIADLSDALPEWKPLYSIFDNVSVQRFAAPSVYSDGQDVFLVVGQQDGRLQVFRSTTNSGVLAPFKRHEALPDIRVREHSSPSVKFRNGAVELSVGDYNGNLRYYVCRNAEAR